MSRPAGMRMRPAGAFTRPVRTAAIDNESAFTMNSMAHEAFHIYIPLP
jgi:hypothetical protein